MKPASVMLLVVGLVVASACGDSGSSTQALRSYVAAVEPTRLGVNRLLDGADPVLEAYRDHRITPEQAAAAMGQLERRFAAYTIDINALKPSDPTLAAIHAPYAHTYILEDSYLSALVAALPSGDFSRLPNTQSEQRAAITQWRVQLEVLARQTGARLPHDLQQAGRGDIAPSPTGSS